MSALAPCDSAHLKRVRALVADGALCTAADLLRARLDTMNARLARRTER